MYVLIRLFVFAQVETYHSTFKLVAVSVDVNLFIIQFETFLITITCASRLEATLKLYCLIGVYFIYSYNNIIRLSVLHMIVVMNAFGILCPL